MTQPNLSNLDGLIGLSRRHGVDIKPTLLRVLTDLYILKPTHSPDEASQYTALALRLLDAVDANTRAIVKEKLVAYGGAPAEVLRRLCGDDLEPAGAQPPPGRAQTGGAEHPAPPREEAHRERVGGGTTALQLTASFFAADSAERRLLLANLDSTGATADQPMPPGEPEKTARRLEESALGGRPGDFVRELERALAVPRAIAQRIVNDPSGEPVVVAAKALGVPLAVLQRILLFVNPAVGHSVRRVYDLTALFDEISAHSARYLVALWRGSDPTPARAAQHPTSGDRTARRVRETAASGNRERPSPIDIDEDLFLDRPQRRG